MLWNDDSKGFETTKERACVREWGKLTWALRLDWKQLLWGLENIGRVVCRYLKECSKSIYRLEQAWGKC